MSYRIGSTPRFKRRLRKFQRAHPELNSSIASLLRDLENDPFKPHLRLHKLSGELSHLHAVSLTHSYRVVLTLEVSERSITLVDIGTHDEVYR